MDTQVIIASIIFFILSFVLLVISIRHFLQKGFLFNNAYLYASKEQRETMDKRPYYRQSAVVLLVLGITFALNGIQLLTKMHFIFWLELILFAGVLIYAIVSAVLIEKKRSKVSWNKIDYK